MRSPITPELLSAYIDDALSEQERLLVEEAIARDPEVAWQVESLRRTVALVQELPQLALPRSFAVPGEQVADVIRSRRQRQLSARQRWRLALERIWGGGSPLFRNLAAAAAVLFVFLLSADLAQPALLPAGVGGAPFAAPDQELAAEFSAMAVPESSLPAQGPEESRAAVQGDPSTAIRPAAVATTPIAEAAATAAEVAADEAAPAEVAPMAAPAAEAEVAAEVAPMAAPAAEAEVAAASVETYEPAQEGVAPLLQLPGDVPPGSRSAQSPLAPGIGGGPPRIPLTGEAGSSGLGQVEDAPTESVDAAPESVEQAPTDAQSPESTLPTATARPLAEPEPGHSPSDLAEAEETVPEAPAEPGVIAVAKEAEEGVGEVEQAPDPVTMVLPQPTPAPSGRHLAPDQGIPWSPLRLAEIGAGLLALLFLGLWWRSTRP